MTISKLFQRIEYGLSNHVDLMALCIVIVGFFTYLYYATGYYLNADEASHFVFANKESLWGAFKASHATAHPPLMIMILHLFMGLGKSVFMLRLMSAVFCTLAAWMTFKWIQRSYGSIEAITGLVLLTFSPAMVSAAVEVRQYAILLFFICGALYFMQRFLEEKILWLGVVYSAFVYGAILAHYSAIWIALSLGIYVTGFFLWKNPGRRVLVFWCLSQAGVCLLYSFLYVTHIKWMLNSGFAQDQIQGYLQGIYFFPSKESAISFISRNTLDFFSYLAGGELAGIIALVCFALGIGYLICSHTTDAPLEKKLFNVLLLTLPFIIGILGAIAQVLPFGGSRHSSYLLPFVIMAITTSIVHVFFLKRFTLVIMAALILFPLTLSDWSPPNVNDGMDEVHMETALKHLNQKVPADAVLFVDDMTHYMLAYYLERDHPSLKRVRHKNVDEYRMGKYCVVNIRAFRFSPSNFENGLVTMSQYFNFIPGDSLWAMTVGWCNSEVFNAFLSGYPPGRIKERYNFGPIILFKVTIPSEM